MDLQMAIEGLAISSDQSDPKLPRNRPSSKARLDEPSHLEPKGKSKH